MKVRLLVCFLGACLFAPAQSVTSATLTGEVLDATGASIAAVGIDVHNLDRDQHWNVRSDSEGRFRFSVLPPGRYELVAEDPRFTRAPMTFVLQVGQTADVMVQLTVAGGSESVDVKAEVPVVESARSQVAETILPHEIDHLPLNGRNYLDLALLTPGVSRTNTGSTQRYAETSAVPGTGISVTGQRNLNNSFIVDGLSANDDAADLAGTFFSQEVIREFQVITSGGIAEFGRASAGVVNITTKSGTNEWHGRAYGFGRNQRLDARNPLATSKDPLTQAQYGASLGGPIRRGQTFFFTNFEQMNQNAAGIITIAPENVTAINTTLDSIGYRGQRITTGEFPNSTDARNFFAKVDHRASERHQAAVRYSFYDVLSTNARGVGGLSAISRGTNLDNRDHTIAGSDVFTASGNTINETRVLFTHSDLAAPLLDPEGPAISISGVANLGTSSSSPTARLGNTFEAAETISLVAGRHTIKAGGDYLLNRETIVFPGALQGTYSFSSLSAFQAGRYDVSFQQAFGAASQFQSNPNMGVFFQDEWRATSRLNVNAGIRYDVQFLPAIVHNDYSNIAPRIGIAYAPSDRKTVIRASYGLYYDRVPLRAVSNALQRDGVKYRVAQLAFGQRGAPVFPNVLPAFPDGLVTNISSMDPNIRNAMSQQSSFQIERELPWKSAVSVSYLHLRGEHLLLSRNINLPVANRPDPRFGNNGRYEGSGDSYYNGMTVALTKRAARWWSLRASYTLSKAIDNSGNFFFSQPQDAFSLRDDRGLSDNDQRHRFVLSGTMGAPARYSNIAFSYLFTYASALPFNIQTGSDRNRDANNNDRPVGVGRNTGRAFDYSSLDIRASKQFRFGEHVRLETLAEGFNLLNRANYLFPNNVWGTGEAPRATFGSPTAASDPRQLQLGLRLSF
jgi:hypothetical protein